MSDFDVDRDRLDEEWMAQPNRVKEASENLADAKKNAALAKRKLEVLEAEISLEVRRNPDKFGLEKATDKSVESAVTTDKRIEKAVQELVNAEHDRDICFAAVSGLSDKKKALEDLVYLWSVSYFSSPKIPNNAREEIGKMKRDQAFGRGKPRE